MWILKTFFFRGYCFFFSGFKRGQRISVRTVTLNITCVLFLWLTDLGLEPPLFLCLILTEYSLQWIAARYTISVRTASAERTGTDQSLWFEGCMSGSTEHNPADRTLCNLSACTKSPQSPDLPVHTSTHIWRGTGDFSQSVCRASRRCQVLLYLWK